MKRLLQFFIPKNSEAEKANALFKQDLAYRDLGNYEKAKEYFEKALEINSESQIVKLKLWQLEQNFKADFDKSTTSNTY